MNRLSAQQIMKLLRDIEDVVIELDEAISVNHISHQDLEKLKHRFDKASKSLNDNEHTLTGDSRLHISDEAEALFMWISGNKEAASDKIAEAVRKKGDTHLTSQAGRGLAIDVKKVAIGKTKKDEGAVTGWLGFFYSTVTIIAVGFLLMTLGATAALFSPPVAGNTAVSAIIIWGMASLSIAYLVLAPRHSRYAKIVAIFLFGLLTLACLVLLFISSTYDGYEDAPEVESFVNLTLLILITCGASTTSYYLRSSRVRRIFNR